jgi:hypothetical protein
MTNTNIEKTDYISLALSAEFPEMNPPDSTTIYKYRHEHNSVLACGLGWWKRTAEIERSEVNALKEKVKALEAKVECLSGKYKSIMDKMEGA